METPGFQSGGDSVSYCVSRGTLQPRVWNKYDFSQMKSLMLTKAQMNFLHHYSSLQYHVY